ncbi:MAG: sugar phosphate isomerase/epimerase family protein, partial [Planctomycetota bacterium]|nr:sugar phosphate isomerase/epimerase family protein [Planctomycetota bacterium]
EQLDLSMTRKDIESAGQRVAVLNTYPDLTHPDSAERRRQFDELQADIVVAAELGAEMVRVTAGQAHPGINRDVGVARAVEGLLRSEKTSEKCGVMLVYENHSKPGIWDYPDFSYPSDVFLEIAAGLRSSGIRILFDTANPVSQGHDPLSVLERVMDRVSCVHAADTSACGVMDWVLVGSGAVPFNELFFSLKRSGYNGWISIEEASGQGRSGMEAAVEFIRKTWGQAR